MKIQTKKHKAYEVEVFVQDEKDAFPLKLYKLAGVNYNDELILAFDIQPNIDYDIIDGAYIDGDIYVHNAAADVWEPCGKMITQTVRNALEEHVSQNAIYFDDYMIDRAASLADRMEDR